MNGNLWISFCLQRSQTLFCFSSLSFPLHKNSQEMYKEYPDGQYPFVGQFIPTGTLNTTNAMRNMIGLPGPVYCDSYVNPRDLHKNSRSASPPLTRENNGSRRIDSHSTYAYPDYNSSKTPERRHHTTGTSRSTARTEQPRSYYISDNHDYRSNGDGHRNENYHGPSTRQERAYERSPYPSGSSTTNASPQGTRCPYIDPWMGIQCPKCTQNAQDKRRHWTSVHEYAELVAMTNGTLPEGRGNAITSSELLQKVREKLACSHCGLIFTRPDAQKRHISTFRH